MMCNVYIYIHIYIHTSIYIYPVNSGELLVLVWILLAPGGFVNFLKASRKVLLTCSRPSRGWERGPVVLRTLLIPQVPKADGARRPIGLLPNLLAVRVIYFFPN